MQDIASLGFSIDSSQVRSARDELRGLRESGVGAADAATKLEGSFRSVSPALQEFGRGMDLATGSISRQTNAITELTSRVSAYAREITALQAPLRELVDTTTRLEALSRAFGATAATVETFSRTARSVGLDANDTVLALQRIQSALAGVTAEGMQARRVLADYGVDLRGAGQSDAPRILQQFTSQFRSMGVDRRALADAETVLGPLSADTSVGLQFPAFQTTAQRLASERLGPANAAAARTRSAAVAQARENTRWQEEFADLQTEYMGSGDLTMPGVARGWFESDAAFRRRLEAARSQGAPTMSGQGAGGRFWDRLTGADPVFAANQVFITAERDRERRESWSPLMPNLRAFGRRVQSLFGYYTPGAGPTGPLPPDRTEDFMQGSLALSFDAAMDPIDLARRNAVVGFARDNAWNLPGDPRFSTFDGIMGGLTAGQRSAVQGRFSALDWARNRTAERVSGNANQVRGAFEGGMEGGVAGANRAAALMEAEIRVRQEYLTETGRKIALDREIADIAARERDIRNRATVAIDTETKIIEAGNRAAAQGGSGVDQLAAIQAARYGAAEELTNGPAAAARARSSFANSISSIRVQLAQGQLGIDQMTQNNAVAGNAGATAELQIQRQLTEAIVAAENLRGEAARKAKEELAQITAQMREQQALKDNLTDWRNFIGREVNIATNQMEADAFGGAPTMRAIRASQYAVGQALTESAPMELQRRLREVGPNGELGPPRPNARALAYGLISPGGEFGAYGEQLIRSYESEAERTYNARRPGQRAAIDAAGMVGGNPWGRIGLAARRARRIGEANNDTEAETNDQVALARAQAGASVAESQGGLTYSSLTAGGLDLNMAQVMRSGRFGAADLWMLDMNRQVEMEAANAQISPGARDLRGQTLFTEGAGRAAAAAGRQSLMMDRDAEEYRAQAAAIRESGQALTQLNRLQEENRAVSELVSRARMAEAEAARQAEAGNQAEAATYSKLAQDLKAAADGYREKNRARNEARDAFAAGQEERGNADRLDDLRLETNGGWWRSNASVQRDVAMQRYGRELRTRNPSQNEEWYQARIGEAGEIAKLQELARESAMVRDTFVSMGSAAGSALEQIILKGGNARQVMAALAADMASALMRLGTRSAMNWIVDKVGGFIGGAAAGAGGMVVGGTAISGAGVTAATTAVAGFAQGGIIHPMASGEVVPAMTSRPMANGDTAVMGEAGPEAVMPLVRTPSGSLGVRGAGGGGGNFAPTINIDARGSGGQGGSSPEQAQRIGDMAYQAVKKAMEEHMQEQIRVGGMFNPVFGNMTLSG